jgi:hypothetical protein
MAKLGVTKKNIKKVIKRLDERLIDFLFFEKFENLRFFPASCLQFSKRLHMSHNTTSNKVTGFSLTGGT